MNTTLAEDRSHHRLVTVTVNNRPVDVPGPKATGFEIKQAAIAQGVEIELDFQLALIRSNGKRMLIGDDDEVSVNKNSVFKATAADDNS